jgi:hypothetical protein
VADRRLAKFGLTMNLDFKIFNFAPSFISPALMADSSYISFPRGF